MTHVAEGRAPPHTSVVRVKQLYLPLDEPLQRVDARSQQDLRRDVEARLAASAARDDLDPKAAIRSRHQEQRITRWEREFGSLRTRLPHLLSFFANGSDVSPTAIDPEVVAVGPDTVESELFRLATLLWSVPVSRGYGRRLRFLVVDRANGKLIGLFALGDPVFNLAARDRWIGWSVEDRRERLVDVMDAFVVGAVPPYDMLLGGKLVFSLIGSAEIGAAFAQRYAQATGVISKRKKGPQLALVTVTSALGRSSIYNRLRLADPADPSRLMVDLKPIGWTRGYGHFQVNDALFARMRALLAADGHPYANGHRYGDGPNWRMRVTRVGLQKLGLDAEFQRHGIERQVFALPLAANLRQFLTRQDAEPQIDRPALRQLSDAALARWVHPRAERRPEFASFRKEELLERLQQGAPVLAHADPAP